MPGKDHLKCMNRVYAQREGKHEVQLQLRVSCAQQECVQGVNGLQDMGSLPLVAGRKAAHRRPGPSAALEG